MNLQQVVDANKIVNAKPISITKEYLDFVMQTYPQSLVKVIPNYPSGWQADVLAFDKVWTIACVGGNLVLMSIADFVGFTPEGIVISENARDAIEYESHFLEIEFDSDSPYSPVTCDSFFSMGEPNCFAFCKKKFKETE